jgi:hypothetical protein
LLDLGHQPSQRDIEFFQLTDQLGRFIAPLGVIGLMAQIAIGHLPHVGADNVQPIFVGLIKTHKEIHRNHQAQRCGQPSPAQAMDAGDTQIVNVNSGAQHPPPRFKPFDVRQLFNRFTAARAGPHVGDKARTLAFDQIHKREHKRKTSRVFQSANVFAYQLGAHGVNQHQRLHVVDPEVLRLVVAKVRDGLFCRFLRLRTRHLTAGLHAVRPVQHAISHFNVLTQCILSVGARRLVLLHKQPPHAQKHGQQKRQQDHQRLHLELQVAHQHHSRHPDTV